MDSGISNIINSVLSNPESLSKLMSVMPAVTQMMNGGNQGNQENRENQTNPIKAEPEKAQNSGVSSESLMANAEVANALKNLITAINAASSAGSNNREDTNAGSGGPEVKPDAVTTFAPSDQNQSTQTMQTKLEDIVNMFKSPSQSQENNPNTSSISNMNISDILNNLQNNNDNSNNNNGDNNNSSSTIEKTLDTLKNFSSATSPEKDHRLKLLLALKPFLKDGRKTKIDHAIKYMNAAKIINLFGKNGFV